MFVVALLSEVGATINFTVNLVPTIADRPILFANDLDEGGTAFITGRTASPGDFRSFSYSVDDGLIDLFPGLNNSVFAVNEGGQYIGNELVTNGGFLSSVGFLFDPAVGVRLLPNLGGTASANPQGLNDSGLVLASAVFPGDIRVSAYVWDSVNNVSTLIDPTRSYFSSGSDINEFGSVVGEAWMDLGPGQTVVKHAFRFTLGSTIEILPGLGGDDARAMSVNDFNVAAGWSEIDIISSSRNAVIWDEDGNLMDLGNLGGTFAYANSINNEGQVVGVSRYDSTTRSHGFIYESGQMSDLNALIDASLGIEILTADDINESGQILVRTNLGVAILTPVPVPEPSRVLLVILGLSAVMLRRFRAL